MLELEAQAVPVGIQRQLDAIPETGVPVYGLVLGLVSLVADDPILPLPLIWGAACVLLYPEGKKASRCGFAGRYRGCVLGLAWGEGGRAFMEADTYVCVPVPFPAGRSGACFEAGGGRLCLSGGVRAGFLSVVLGAGARKNP
jgi:hypothetical protein